MMTHIHPLICDAIDSSSCIVPWNPTRLRSFSDHSTLRNIHIHTSTNPCRFCLHVSYADPLGCGSLKFCGSTDPGSFAPSRVPKDPQCVFTCKTSLIENYGEVDPQASTGVVPQGFPPYWYRKDMNGSGFVRILQVKKNCETRLTQGLKSTGLTLSCLHNASSMNSRKKKI